MLHRMNMHRLQSEAAAAAAGYRVIIFARGIIKLISGTFSGLTPGHCVDFLPSVAGADFGISNGRSFSSKNRLFIIHIYSI